MAIMFLALWGLTFSALWASAFIAGKIAIGYCDPFSLLTARFALAGSLMIALSLARNGRRALSGGDLWTHGILLGGLNNALYLGLSFSGLKTLSPEVTVLIVSTSPFLTTGLSAMLGGHWSLTQIAGAAIGFLGVFTVLSTHISSGPDLIGIILVFSGTMAFSVGTVYYRRNATHHDPVAISGIQNIAGAIMLLPFATDMKAPFAAMAQMPFLLSFLHLVIAVSIVDFLLWLGLVRRVGAAHAASFHLLNPVFGVVFSAAILGTHIMVRDIAGGLIVITGLAVVIWDAANRRGARA